MLRQAARLQAAELLYEARLFPDLEYTFKHALTHEVAYQGLLRDRRRALHARVVDGHRAAAPERVAEQAERLAHHALRGELWEKAVALSPAGRAQGIGAVGLPRGPRLLRAGARGRASTLPESRPTTEQAFDLRLELRARSTRSAIRRVLGSASARRRASPGA